VNSIAFANSIQSMKTLPNASPCKHRLAIAILNMFLVSIAVTAAEADYEARRQRMVAEINATYELTAGEIRRSEMSPAVHAAMGHVPRHEFVPQQRVSKAYENRPLPIGYGQTISQPYIVALMTDLLELGGDEVVLEIGTGSGYQAAVLAELVPEVYTIEIIEPLGKEAESRLRRLGLHRIHTRIGDGYFGWPEVAPFDRIIVTAAADHIPPPLIEQLKPGGKMVLPVGSGFLTQHLVLVEKNADGTVSSEQILPVRFVPLTGAH
jgi:protein-L-isoaspartate(D-aspartate) O-methyltransferase